MKKILYGAVLLSLLMSTAPSFAEAPSSVRERYNVYYNNGVELYGSKKYTASIAEFKKVLRYAPYDKNVKNALIKAYSTRADYYYVAKQVKQAINDMRSELFYSKYWTDEDKAKSDEIAKREAMLNQLLKSYENLPTADAKFQNAKTLRSQGEIAAAGYELNKIANDQKLGYNARVLLYDIYKSLNNQQMALENIRIAVKIKPDSGIAHFKYGVLLDDIQNYDAANDEYALAFKYSDSNQEVLSALTALWSIRIQNNPKDSSAMINLGALYQKTKQYDLAKAEYQKALEIKPNDPLVMSNLATLYLETKDHKSALSEFRRVLKIDPNNEGAKAGIEDIVANLKGADLTEYLKEEAEMNPFNPDKQFDYAFELHKLKSYPEAIGYYKKVIAINPKMAEPYINIAQIYRLQNDNEKVNAVVSHGLSNLPDNKELLEIKNDLEQEAAGAVYNAAGELYEAGKYSEAIATYKKIKMQTPEVLYAIASCYIALHQNEEAKVILNQILANDPNNLDAKNAISAIEQAEEGQKFDMAIAKFEKKEYKEALSLFDEILSKNPKNAYAYYYKGMIFDDTDKKDFAIEAYKKAVELDSKLSVCYYMLAVDLDGKEMYKEAVTYYEKYLSSSKAEDDYSKYVKSRVKELKEYLEQQK